MNVEETPLVSIVIPVYNGSNYMREAIDSALAQTYPNIEVIVVNDGSTDATREIALSYGNRIRYFEKENGGVSTALNLAIRNMNGQYFSWLSHDDVYYPDKVEAEIDALRENGDMNLAVYGGMARLCMPERKVIPHLLKKRYSEKFLTAGIFASVFGCISGCSLMIPKSYFDVYGMFDESLRSTQDEKKWFEMFHDKRLLYVDKILIQSRRHNLQVTYTYSFKEYEDENLFLWMMQNVTEDDVASVSFDLYQYFSATMIRMTKDGHSKARDFLLSRLSDLPETCSAETKRRAFQSWLRGIGGNRVYIYCAGRYGQTLVEAFYLREIAIDGIVDSNDAHWGEQIGCYECGSPECLMKDDTIIIAKYAPLSIQEELEKSGFRHLITFGELEERLSAVPIKKQMLFQ